MNILFNKLPNKDKYGNAIHTSFKRWIAFLVCLDDKSLPETLRAKFALQSVYPKLDDQNIPKYLDGALDFVSRWNGNIKPAPNNSNPAPVVDFTIDQHSIYSSFLKDYSIDLQASNMHFYQFMSLLFSLSQDTKFGEALYYRSVKISSDCDKYTRKQIQNAKMFYSLNKTSSIENIPEDQFIKEVKEQARRLKNV